MKYKSFEIEKYKGIDICAGIPKVLIKVEENKAVALIGINECGKSTILKAIYSFDYRNDTQNNLFKHLQILKNRNKTGGSLESAIISADFELEQNDIKMLCDYFNKKNMFNTIKTEEVSNENEEQQTNFVEREKSDEEKVSIIQKAFKYFRIKCQLEKENGSTVRKYFLILKDNAKDGFDSNINQNLFRSQENDFCKYILDNMPNMLYITDLPDFYSDNNFSTNNEDSRHEQCKILINNLFIAGTTRSLNVQQFFELFNSDRSEYSATRSQVEQYLNNEFSNRWNEFGLNSEFGELDIEIEAFPDSKIIRLQVREKNQTGNNYYPIDERSMGFQWFFKFVMNISFTPLKDKGVMFLIDEPGTYLHETAQSTLSKELNSMLDNNYMIFSTHYYSMLNLKEIELNRIYIVERGLQSIVATKATDYQGYSNESKKSPILPILNSFRKTIIDYIKYNETKKILIVEGLHDKYALNVFCESPKWAEIEIFPSVGAPQIADNMSEFSYYKNDVLALFDNDEAGVAAMNKINSKNAILLNVREGYKEDNSKKLEMDDLFDSEELSNLSIKMSSVGIENFGTYKDIIRLLYENKHLIEKYKDILPKTLDNFKKLEESILIKLKLIRKLN